MGTRHVRLATLSLLLLLPAAARADEAAGSMWTLPEESSGTFGLDRGELARRLAAAPREFTDGAQDRAVLVALPMPDGKLLTFRVQDSPVLPPALEAKYGIKTYAARGVDDPATIARFDLGPFGFHALVLAPSGSIEIRPEADDLDRYVSAKPREAITRCMADDLGMPPPKPDAGPSPFADTEGMISNYYIATTATGEFTAQNGGTVASALSAITTTINGVNAIYRRDFGIHLALVDDVEQLIQTQPSFLLPTGDLDCGGGASCLNPTCLWVGNACVVNGLIGSDNYDLAIVFDATAADGSAVGRAFLNSVCNTTAKAWGATGGTYVDLAAHEIGHMFGGHHTFNDIGDNCGLTGQRDANWAYEPGSGSTLMSYAGTCGASNLQGGRTLAFHADNVRDVLQFIQVGAGATCASYGLSTGNYAPIIQSLTGTHTVPASTPFLLKVGAYDPNGDTVTYSFDESDIGNASPPEGDDGSRPIYRVYPPSTSGERSFPSYNYVLNNANVPPATLTCGTATCLSGESLHTTTRTMQFSIILRDGVDGVTLAGTTVNVDGTTGPFVVTNPDTGTVWTQGTRKTITWNVGGTNAGGPNTANVKISLSTDGGSTWPHVLASSTPNDGSELVTLPFAISGIARIKVEAIGNIFYDVSKGFTIRDIGIDTVADSGPGSLRQAILDANDYPNGATIPLRYSGGGPRTINVTSQLPTITKPFALDAWEIGGAEYTGPPLLELVGSGCPDTLPGVPCDGLVIQGDTSFINGIVVRNFAGNGIVLRGAAAYAGLIQNSYIGTNLAGDAAAGNGKSGILIDGGYGNPAYGNVLSQNVISGNQVGVTINGSSANGNALLGNRIGTNAAGTGRIPNLDDGVRIIGAPNTRIGQPGEGNLISGNGTILNGAVDRQADGIDVSGATATGTIIQANTLGLDVTGSIATINTAQGINVSGAPGTLIGGTAAGTRNVIADGSTVNFHFAHCVQVTGAGATGTVIQGNYLGTDATGSLDRGCRGAGVYVSGAPGVQIGGTTTAARNVISGNNDYGGVWLTGGANGAVIQGNYIGTDVTGTLAVPNNPFGIEIATGGNTIGGATAGARNVISGNTQRGIDLNENVASNNVIQGNFIGTNAAGTAAIGNGIYGINLLRAENNLIGGTAPGAGNVISGNGGGPGIYQAQGFGLVIQGNFIGTNAAGTAAIGNGRGIELYEMSNVTIGGTAAGAGNLISANGNNAVRIYSLGTPISGIVVQGNKIGTNAAGTAALGNGGEGIWGSILGTATIKGNVVAASSGDGLNLTRGAFTVQGNWVGTDVTGTLDLRNTGSGIYSSSDSPSLIGGTGPGEANVVAFNGGPGTNTNFGGIVIRPNAVGQTIRGNKIYSNTGLGIDLHFGGVAGNDACDADTGANDQQNFPVLTASNQSGSSTHVTGTLNSKPSTAYTVDFYASPSCDSFGFGEGSTYLGSTSVTTDGSCNGSFNLVLPVSATGIVTATATDPAGATSEFSSCRVVGPSPVAEVTGVGWASKAELTWSAAAGATSYRVLSGAPSAFPDLLDGDADSCTRFTGSALTTGPTLTDTPSAATRFYWYLVVGSNGIDDGPFGAATAGVRIANSSGACP